MDWKAIPNYVLLVGLFVAMVTMFNQVNGRIDALNGRIDIMQAEMNRRFDSMQTEMNQRFDQVLEVLRLFEGRITRLEERAGIGSGSPE